jgi:myo-inositol 2-dehydrogenase/D-chiro-inositol 1-dehydrogenase
VANARLVAVADSDPRRCAALAPGVAAYPSVDALIAAGDVDAVVVATPAAAHVPAARAVARAGLPALVEKPPAPDADGARELAALRPAPWIGFNRRFLPAVAALRGREPAHLRVVVHYRRASWQSVEVHDDALLDLGPHAIDLVHWIGSPVRRVRTTALSHDRCELELELERGTASVSCATDRIHRELVEARDASGSLVARDARGGVARAIVARLRPPTEHALVDSLAAELEALCAAVRGGDPGALATAEDGVAAMAAVDAARRSRGVWVVPS